MDLIRRAMIFAILGTMFLGIAAVNAQINATLPQFKSGASVMMGVPVDFNILNQRVGMIYEVVESNDSHIVWKFTGTTGDWAFVFADGRIIVASAIDLDLAAKDTLTKELNDVIDLLNVVSQGITSEARNNALESTIYYASEKEIYHRIIYNFNSDFNLKLLVPNCSIEKARLTITGNDGGECAGPAPHHYYQIDGIQVTGGCPSCSACTVPAVDIEDKIPSGVHTISAVSINQGHSMIIEAITSPAPKKFVLYSDDYMIWINETSESTDLQALQNILGGKVAPTHNYSETIPGYTLPGEIIGIDPTSFPKVRVNVFVNTTCAKSGGLKKDNFKVMEESNEAAINSSYFTGNASGQKLDLAIAFDDTGSMQPQIDAMKSKVQSLTNQIKDTGMDVKYALVTFKDNVSIKANWTSDPNDFKDSINTLKAIGGEDVPENSLDAIENVISMGFRPDTQKVILVITDAPAHYKGDGTTYSMYTKDEVMSDLKKNGIIFIPVSSTIKSPSEAVDLRDIANEIQSMWIDMNSANFSTILEQFKRIITGTYVLEYTSTDLTTDTNRNVTVAVNNPSCDGAVGSATVTYISPMKTFSVEANNNKSVILDMCSLPSTQGWKYVSEGNSVPENSVFSIQNLDQGCILRQDSMGVGQANQGSCGYQIDNVVDPSKPFVLKIKARVLAEEGDINSNHFGFCIGVGTGAEAFAIAIGPSTIESIDNENENRVLSNSIDNTKFHNYRLEGTPGVGYRFYVDNNIVATGVTKNAEGDNRLYLGDGTGGTNAKADVASFEFTQSDYPLCSIEGTWAWFSGQTVVVNKNGTLSIWTGPKLDVTGNWMRINATRNLDVIQWNPYPNQTQGYVDTLVLSPDCMKLEGYSVIGTHVTGNRMT